MKLEQSARRLATGGLFGRTAVPVTARLQLLPVQSRPKRPAMLATVPWALAKTRMIFADFMIVVCDSSKGELYKVGELMKR